MLGVLVIQRLLPVNRKISSEPEEKIEEMHKYSKFSEIWRHKDLRFLISPRVAGHITIE